MRAGAGTPEELETLLEDAFLLRDVQALSELFVDGACLVTSDGPTEVHGADAITRAVERMWDAGRCYVSEARRIVQAGRTALLIGPRTVGVLHRGDDRSWRYVIAVLEPPS